MARNYSNVTPSALAALSDQPSPALEDVSAEVIDFPSDDEVELTIDLETGEVSVETEDDTPADSAGHMENLANLLDEDELEELGAEILRLVETDEESRAEWYKRYKAGLEALGIYNIEKVNEVLDTIQIKHPLLIEAATQFQSRAMAELLPAKGPVKAGLFGDVDQELFDQGRRVEQFMNYQLTIEDRGYYDERDQMLFKLPFTGSEFDKQYYCPVKKRVVSKWVHAENFIVPYKTTSLEDAPRYTEVLYMQHTQYRRLVKAGFYRDVDLEATGETQETGEKANVFEVIDTMQGESKPSAAVEGSKEHKFFECHIELDLPGYEEDIALPYVVTVDSETGEVLAIYRNWKAEDEDKKKRVWYTHKKFLPGFGFYGFGLLHAIGGLGELASRLLDVLLDAGAFASLQGGFKSKDAKLKGDITLVPGQWQDTEMTAEELEKAFYTPPFKEPSQTLFQLLGLVVEGGQRFAATTETMVGDAATTGPVGSMVAQIEQGSKVFSGIHKRLHKAFGDEFIHIAELNGEWLPDTYPYKLRGTEQNVLRQDFDGRIDVVPVSDPNIFSSAQRLAIAQTSLQIVGQFPDLADRREAVLDLMRAIRHPDPERLFPDKKLVPRTDPVTEGALMLAGKAVRAYGDQHHQAHNAVHQLQLQQAPDHVKPTIQAHIMSHMSMAQRLEMQNAMGFALPPMDLYADPEEMVPQLPPEIENQIAMRAAQVAQQMLQQMREQQAKQENAAQMQAQQEAQAKVQADMAKAQSELQFKAQESQAKAQLEMAKLQQAAQAQQAELATRQQEAQMRFETDMAKIAEQARSNSIAEREAETRAREVELRYNADMQKLQQDAENARMQSERDMQAAQQQDAAASTEQTQAVIAQFTSQIEEIKRIIGESKPSEPQAPPVTNINLTVEKGGTVKKEITMTSPDGKTYTGKVSGDE